MRPRVSDNNCVFNWFHNNRRICSLRPERERKMRNSNKQWNSHSVNEVHLRVKPTNFPKLYAPITPHAHTTDTTALWIDNEICGNWCALFLRSKKTYRGRKSYENIHIIHIVLLLLLLLKTTAIFVVALKWFAVLPIIITSSSTSENSHCATNLCNHERVSLTFCVCKQCTIYGCYGMACS